MSEHNDTIIYNSQTDESRNVIQLTNKVISLWLNDKHYDLALNFRHFKFGYSNYFCVKCMKHYFSKKELHVHIVYNTCFKCFTIHYDKYKKLERPMECSLCNILFYDQTCYEQNFWNEIFSSVNRNMKIPPCQYYMYCEKCKSVVSRFFGHGKFHNHNCNKVFSNHCKKYAKVPHYCFIKPLEEKRMEMTYPIFFF